MFNCQSIGKFFLIFVLFFNFSQNTFLYASNGKITGKVTDSGNGAALPGATIIIKGTAIGAATNYEGIYILSQVPEGKQILFISYVGYNSKELKINVIPGQTLLIDVELDFNTIDIKEVVVTAQLEGQAAAINQQLTSSTIINVVSKDKIQELPDQNAAETLGRLPGISIQRNNGEGQKVVVRGLSPRFSAITVNGVQLPATSQPGDFSIDGSSASDDRSVDLSIISPDVLEGIEVYKALRADMDADAIGGTVNFTTKKASECSKISARLFGGYNQLEEDFGNYRGSLAYSNRFFTDENGKSKLGLVLSGNIQKANRSSEGVGGYYSWVGEVEGEPVYQTTDVTLTKHNEIRKRYGLNLTLDYELAENQNIFLTSLLAGTNQDEKNQIHDYTVSTGIHDRNFFEREVEMNTWSNSLNGKHILGITEIDWTVSYSKSKENTPWAAYAQFSETSGFTNNMPIRNLSPKQVSDYTINDAHAAWMNSSYLQYEDVKDQNMTSEINIQHPFLLGNNISGYVKVGAKIRNKDRNKNVDQWGGLRWYTGQKIMATYPDKYISATNSSSDISLINFISSTKSLKNFLSGDYQFNEVLDEVYLHDFIKQYESIYKQTRNYKVDVHDYNAGEIINSVYFMTEIKWGQLITFMPGLRYEKTLTDYSTKVANPNTSNIMLQSAVSDSAGNRNYANILPMAQIRIKPFDWMDIRLAATKSLSRPNYLNLIPYEMVDFDGQTLRFGNPNLKETKANNYDIYFSFYESKWGLLTIGRFYKQLYNIDYIRTRKITSAIYYAPYLTNLKGYTVTSPDNLSEVTKVEGWEFEAQTNLSFLPSPFDGILLYANYSIVHSETNYPYTITRTTYLTTAPYVKTIAIDTTRTGRMIGQADQIANLTIGYEKGGLSTRFSMIYQGDALRSIGISDADDGLDDAYVRWDLVVQQHILNNFSMILQINNITNRKEETYMRYKDFSTRIQDYGMTLDLGVQYKF